MISAVAARLREMIRTHELPDGHGLPSERRLSADLSVSRGVVRSAIKELADSGLIEAKPRCRPVVRAPKGLSRTDRRHIGIWLWPSTADYAAASILKGIQSTELGQDMRLIIANAVGQDWESRWDSEVKFLRSLADDPEEAGAIVWYLGSERNRAALQALRDANVATVFIDRMPPAGFAGDFVGTNNASAAKAGVDHLIALGHRRIALITNMDPVSSVREREQGYALALRAAGIPRDPALIQRDKVDEPEGVEAALDSLLRLKERPTAVFCINDQLALQVYEAIQAQGLSIPRDMSVLGFDGVLRWVPGGGYLTTLCQDFERIGQLAAELVVERMTSGPPEAYRHVLLDAHLLDRGSTAPPAPASSTRPGDPIRTRRNGQS